MLASMSLCPCSTILQRKLLGNSMQGRTRPVPVGPQNRAILRAELILATMVMKDGYCKLRGYLPSID